MKNNCRGDLNSLALSPYYEVRTYFLFVSTFLVENCKNIEIRERKRRGVSFLTNVPPAKEMHVSLRRGESNGNSRQGSKEMKGRMEEPKKEKRTSAVLKVLRLSPKSENSKKGVSPKGNRKTQKRHVRSMPMVHVNDSSGSDGGKDENMGTKL